MCSFNEDYVHMIKLTTAWVQFKQGKINELKLVYVTQILIISN